MAKPTKKSSTSNAEACARKLSLDPVTQKKIALALDMLGFDDGFVYVYALVNELSESFTYFDSHSGGDDFVSEWAKIWLTAKEKIEKSPNDFPAQEVPVVGETTIYPLVLMLGRKVPKGCDFIHCCKVVFFKQVWFGEITRGSSKAKEIARQLRLCTAPSGERIGFVSKLIFTKGSIFGDYLKRVGDHLETKYSKGELTTDLELLVIALSKLLEFKVSRRSTKKQHEQSDNKNGLESLNVTKSIFNIAPATANTAFPVKGTIKQTTSITSSENIFDIQDPLIDAFVDSTEDQFEPNDVANLNRSLRWIHNTRAVSPSSPQRFNQIERSKFLKQLRILSCKEPEAAISIYFLYITNLNIDELWELKLGVHIELKIHAVLIRTLPTLEQAYAPSQQLRSAFEEKTSLLKLVLPEELTSLLKKLSLKKGNKLVESFQLDRHQMKDRVQEIIQGWREQGNVRFHYNRVTAALSTELTILNNDPLITYLLSGEPIHLSPTLRFYRPTSINYLKSCWDKAVISLLQLQTTS